MVDGEPTHIHHRSRKGFETMKTAEEWVKECWQCKVVPELHSTIKQIQLDAFKAGERFAAEYIGPKPLHTMTEYQDRTYYSEAILTDAQQRTEIPI